MMTPPPRQPASRLEALLRDRQFAITAEITPPVACEAEDLLRKALPLAGLADAVNVTDGAVARLAAGQARGQGRRRRPVRADPVLHGRGHRTPLRGVPCRARADAGSLSAHRRCPAALGEIGALDAAAPLWDDHSGELDRPAR